MRVLRFDGRLTPGSVAAYDRWAFPVSRLLDAATDAINADIARQGREMAETRSRPAGGPEQARKSTGQPGDDVDSFFASARNRELAERMISNGTIERSAARSLLKGDVRINVEVWRGGDGDYLNVTVD